MKHFFQAIVHTQPHRHLSDVYPPVAMGTARVFFPFNAPLLPLSGWKHGQRSHKEGREVLLCDDYKMIMAALRR